MTHDIPPLPAVEILGVGAIVAAGRNLEDIAKNLAAAPAPLGTAMRVADQGFVDAAIGNRMRRADRFSRMATVAALDAWKNAHHACTDVPMTRVGLILSSGLGPHCRGFKFIDGILDCGDSALPTDFSHSVHGAATAYIAELLGLRGCSLTITDFESGFEQAVLLAQCWLAQGTCDRVLVGAVDELGEVMLHCASRIMQGFATLPGEGAVFLTLGPAKPSGRYDENAIHLDANACVKKVDLLIVEDPPLPTHVPYSAGIDAARTTTFTPYFGMSSSGPAFQLLGGILSLQTGRAMGTILNTASNPVATPVAVDSAATIVASSASKAASIMLLKKQ